MVGYTRGFFDLAPQATWTRNFCARYQTDGAVCRRGCANGDLGQTPSGIGLRHPSSGSWEAGIEFSVANKTVGS